jgi:hypothetical protein
LTGGNPRFSCEQWLFENIFTKLGGEIERIFVNGKEEDPDFITNAPLVAAQHLVEHYNRPIQEGPGSRNDPFLNSKDITLCRWILGFTDKAWENLYEKDAKTVLQFTQHLYKQRKLSRTEYESLVRRITFGHMVLSKRGAVKSMMGNLYESLMLFISLTLLGFRFVPRETFAEEEEVGTFTLDVNRRRQADALISVQNQKKEQELIHVDIGYIGKGNPEITGDKQTRFRERLDQRGHLNRTLVIIWNLPETEDNLVIRMNNELEKVEVISMCDQLWLLSMKEYFDKTIGHETTIELPPDKHEQMIIIDKHLEDMISIIESIPKEIGIPEKWLSEVELWKNEKEKNLDSLPPSSTAKRYERTKRKSREHELRDR